VLTAAIITATATVVLAAVATWQIYTSRQQTEATLEIATETRQAAERQWQPRVVPNAWNGPIPGTGDDAAPDEVGVRYYLSNDGTRPAFNVEHGVEVVAKLHTSAAGIYATVRTGEQILPMFDSIGQPVSLTPLTVGVKRDEWDDDFVYWTRFENLLGERFEVRTFPEPVRPVEFRRVS
jgi:hypothetical protein